MLKRMIGYIGANGLISKGDKVLLAVSGGIDSVAMAELFHQAGLRFAIAHCNFGLREDESDEDEQFVSRLAQKYHVPFYCKSFPTTQDAHDRGVSIQMAARDLRYQWFEEVRSAEGFDSIAIGHHLDDQIETFFINLLRGTGVQGLHGILPKNGYVIRPLLFATRDEIGAFIRAHHLTYREDSSNSSRKYLRNRIRHEVIPLLKDIQPGFTTTMSENMTRIREAVAIYKQKVEEVRQQVVKKRERKILLPINLLDNLRPEITWLFELLSPYGFNEAVVADIAAALHQPGKKEFISDGWKAVKDRDEIILTRRVHRGATEPGKYTEYLIQKGDTLITIPVILLLEEVENKPETEIPTGREFASLDLDKLEFPLRLRRWKAGDSFVPFGMNMKKKLSDYFIDAKISTEAKQHAWILWSGNKIAWVVGQRPDNRFRVSSRTRAFLRIKYAGNPVR